MNSSLEILSATEHDAQQRNLEVDIMPMPIRQSSILRVLSAFPIRIYSHLVHLGSLSAPPTDMVCKLLDLT